jgi:hypothetical protein
MTTASTPFSRLPRSAHSDAIDAAMSHADLEGYRRCKREVEQAALEKAARAMNETGQGEHGGLVSAIENIWGLPPRRVA